MFRTVEACLTYVSKKVGSNPNELATLFLMDWYQTRYRETYGRLRTEAENAFLNFRRCGDPNFGVTLFRCDTCDVKLGVPFTCKTRICPSCLSRKAETRALHLSEVLPQVCVTPAACEHRHIVFGLPKKMELRQRIQEDPKLLRKVTRLVNQTIAEHLVSCVIVHRHCRDELKKASTHKNGYPESLWPNTLGRTISQATRYEDYHPHLHLCISDGVFTTDGDFYEAWDWKPEELKEKLRRRILKAFVWWEKLTGYSPDN
jgi:hypothetical protein